MTEKLSKGDFAKKIGVSNSQISQLINAGRVVLDGEGKYAKVLVDESIALIESTKDLSKKGVADRHANERAEKTGEPQQTTPQIEESGKASSVYQQSKAMREKYNAMLAKLEFEKAIGKVLDLNDVTLAISRAATDLRGQLETLPDRFAAQFAAENDPAKIRLQAAETIEHLLTGLEKHFKKLAIEHHE